MCDKEEKDADNESIISDRCWKETYKGDSRKWLLRGVTPNSLQGVTSNMKESYQYPENFRQTEIGRRKAIFLKKTYAKVTQEIIDELNKKPEVEEYLTSYDDDFGYLKMDCVKKDPIETEELYNKYPLYGSQVMSYWKHQWDNRRVSTGKAPQNLTTVLDLKVPFKRNSAFTKPISEALDADTL